LVHTKKPVQKLEDLKGMRIRATGSVARIVGALGATPVAMPMPDTYDALSRGVAEGVVCPFEALEGWRLGEVVKFTTQNFVAANSLAMFVVMNKETWNSLSPEIQKIIEKINEEWIPKQAAVWDEVDKSGLEFVSKRGHKIIPLSTEQQGQWAKAVRPLLDDYVNRMKAKGLPGEEVLKFCLDRLKVIQ
jgi:TRAP-type C4-dicarboxylate transport system substrate-binding protein